MDQRCLQDSNNLEGNCHMTLVAYDFDMSLGDNLADWPYHGGKNGRLDTGSCLDPDNECLLLLGNSNPLYINQLQKVSQVRSSTSLQCMVDSRCEIWHRGKASMFLRDTLCHLLFLLHSKTQEDKAHYKCHPFHLVHEIWPHLYIGILHYKVQLHWPVQEVHSTFQGGTGGTHLKTFHTDQGDTFHLDRLHRRVLPHHLDNSVQENKELDVLKRYLHKCSQVDTSHRHSDPPVDRRFLWDMLFRSLFLWDKSGLWDKLCLLRHLLGLVL